MKQKKSQFIMQQKIIFMCTFQQPLSYQFKKIIINLRNVRKRTKSDDYQKPLYHQVKTSSIFPPLILLFPQMQLLFTQQSINQSRQSTVNGLQRIQEKMLLFQTGQLRETLGRTYLIAHGRLKENFQSQQTQRKSAKKRLSDKIRYYFQWLRETYNRKQAVFFQEDTPFHALRFKTKNSTSILYNFDATKLYLIFKAHGGTFTPCFQGLRQKIITLQTLMLPYQCYNKKILPKTKYTFLNDCRQLITFGQIEYCLKSIIIQILTNQSFL
eukprot:TRINITY_DN12521_c0_g1_i3.p1 TRINITY_DN12521_c0_g1~~TRINITY_DN12521_c0_g1_i3.p1  ORF type:complete len:269 (-),score=-26.03 TRINITY_DN12521_c0_g1_i3:276-1082(-)